MGCLLLRSTEGQGGQRPGLSPASEASIPKHQLLGTRPAAVWLPGEPTIPGAKSSVHWLESERQNCQSITSSIKQAEKIPMVQLLSHSLWWKVPFTAQTTEQFSRWEWMLIVLSTKDNVAAFVVIVKRKIHYTGRIWAPFPIKGLNAKEMLKKRKINFFKLI